MTHQDLIVICWEYEKLGKPSRIDNWYDIATKCGDWRYTMYFHLEWARAKLEEMNRLNRQLKSLIG